MEQACGREVEEEVGVSLSSDISCNVSGETMEQACGREVEEEVGVSLIYHVMFQGRPWSRRVVVRWRRRSGCL